MINWILLGGCIVGLSMVLAAVVAGEVMDASIRTFATLLIVGSVLVIGCALIGASLAVETNRCECACVEEAPR